MNALERPFPWAVDSAFELSSDSSCKGFFGQDVLGGLIAGIDEFHASKTGRHQSRVLGSGLLGAFMWLDDPELIKRVADFPYASVAITKQKADRWTPALRERLGPLLTTDGGFPAEALPKMRGLAEREKDGTIPVVGPSGTKPVARIPALRAVGYRRTGKRMVPLLHTKVVLLGEVWWHDEDDFGPADVTGFRPEQVWVGSANGTWSSRRSLEFGMWSRDPALLRAAEDFITGVLANSENFDPAADTPRPDLVDPSYDDAAFADADPPWDDFEELS